MIYLFWEDHSDHHETTFWFWPLQEVIQDISYNYGPAKAFNILGKIKFEYRL